MVLHTPTLFLMIIVASVVMGVAIAVIAHPRHPNLRLWSAGLMLHGLGYVLYSLRGAIPDWVSIVVANVAIASSLALFGEGLYRFQQRPAPRGLLWAPVGGAALGFGVLLHAQGARFVLASLLFGAQALFMLVTLLQRWRLTAGRGQYILAGGIVVVLALMVGRVLGVLTGALPITTVSESSLIQGGTFMATLVGVLLLSLGLLMMNQERAESALLQEQVVDQFRGHILEMITTGAPLPQLLVALVHGIERLHPDMLCSVLMLDRQGQHLQDGIAPSLPDFYNRAIRGLAIGPGVGSCGAAAYTGQRVVVDDIAHHPNWAPYVELAAKAGLGACWSQPILSTQGKVLGTFAIYHRQPHTPSAQDIQLIEQSARLASIAIERSREAIELKQSEARYRRLVTTANEGICVVQAGLIRFANPKLCALAGLPEEALVGQAFEAFIQAEDAESVWQHRLRQGEQGEFKYPVRLMTRHKGARWFELNGTGFEWEGQPATLNFLTDITDRKAMEEQVRQFAYQDALTGLPNRRLLMDRLALTMARLKRTGQHGALLFLDLDNFKPLNDLHGHDAGNMLLIEVATRLKRVVREADTVARFGGDEFVLVLGDLDGDADVATRDALAVADKIQALLSSPYRLTLPEMASRARTSIEHHCSASIGLRLFVGEPGTEDACLRQADEAMYQAKQAGRHTIRLAGLAAPRDGLGRVA